MALFEPYKPDQAKACRTITFLSGVALLVWGARSCMLTLPRFWSGFGRALDVWLFDAALDDALEIDVFVYAGPLSIAFVGTVLGLLLLLVWWYRFLQKPKYAEMLIDMQTELKKVSWPNQSDAWQSTLVVTGCTVVIVALLFVYDFVINHFMRLFTSA